MASNTAMSEREIPDEAIRQSNEITMKQLVDKIGVFNICASIKIFGNPSHNEFKTNNLDDLICLSAF